MQKDTIVKISSILQCQKIPEGICIRLENYFFLNWKQRKTILRSRKPLQKGQKVENSKSLFGMSHSAEHTKESSMLAELSVSCKN